MLFLKISSDATLDTESPGKGLFFLSPSGPEGSNEGGDFSRSQDVIYSEMRKQSLEDTKHLTKPTSLEDNVFLLALCRHFS